MHYMRMLRGWHKTHNMYHNDTDDVQIISRLGADHSAYSYDDYYIGKEHALQ